MTAASSRITKLGGDTLPAKAFGVCKTNPPSCFCWQIDILWIVSFFKIGEIMSWRERMQLIFSPLFAMFGNLRSVCLWN
jgi:hypothetical protein